MIQEFYTGKNPFYESFEKTEEIRRYLSSLVKTEIKPIVRGYYYNSNFYSDVNHTSPIEGDANKAYVDIPSGHSYKYTTSFERLDDGYISNTSIDITLPPNLWFITYESATVTSEDNCLEDREIEVIPTTQDTFFRTRENPFKTTGSRRAFRLDVSGDKVEIVSKYPLKQYLVRYVEKPTPIILVALPNDLSIKGSNTPQTCGLTESLHRPILEQAVILALRSRGINLNNNQ